jgi:putative membrane protein insertion efficiency factor
VNINRALSLPFIVVIKLYQYTLSPFVGRHCRFHPTCSWYALEAYRVHGPFRGTALTVRRLLKCHPLHRGGYDPVPEERSDR